MAHADRFDDIRDHIRERLVADSIPSLSVAVVRDGRILWEEGFGWADRERRIAATEHTAYSLASVTKPITATGLMTLVESGAIDLDAPVNAYLGGAKLRARVGDANAATVRRVANHTSGLPVHYQFFYADEPYRPPSRDETILRYGNLVAAPGERHEYSNLGYGVLDYVIQRVSGESYAEFMRRVGSATRRRIRDSTRAARELEGHAGHLPGRSAVRAALPARRGRPREAGRAADGAGQRRALPERQIQRRVPGTHRHGGHGALPVRLAALAEAARRRARWRLHGDRCARATHAQRAVPLGTAAASGWSRMIIQLV
jgi:hypothetical protein